MDKDYILKHSAGNLYWKDIQGRYQGANNAFMEIMNIKKVDNVIGRTDRELFSGILPDEQLSAIEEIDQSVFKTGKGIRLREEGIDNQGKKAYYITNKIPFFDDKSGRIIGLIGTSIDITAEVLLEKKLKEEKIKSEAASQAKTEFLENMRHDIRTPLTGIVGFSDIIKAEAENPSVKEYADNLVASSHALLKLMDEVLEAVRVSSGEIPGVKKKFSLKKSLQHIIDLNRAKAASKRLDLQLEYDEKLPNYVIGDNIRIHRVVLELVSNALNFTDAGFVNITAELAQQEDKKLIVKLIVQDSGMGIPPERKQEIFLQFKRLTPSYQGIYKGAGLGLSVVKQFVDDVNGEIYVESEPNKGSLFTCVIPLQKPLLDDSSGVESDREETIELPKELEAPSQKNITTNGPKNKKTSNRILVVEDNPVAQQVAQAVLNRFDCQVDVANNGKEALQLWKPHSYDLIFMDIGLPDLDGYEVTHHIRVQEVSNKSHLPIVALTAHASEENKERCISAGMNAVLTKPLTVKRCEDVLNSFIASRKQTPDENINPHLFGLPENEQQMFDLSECPILDVEIGLESTSTKEMLTEMLEILVTKALPDDFELMKQAHDAGDWDKTQQLAHKIKGGAVYVGTVKIKMACQYLEGYWKSGQRELLEALYQQVVSVVEESIQSIKRWLAD
ncbi:response regulator [Legionella yabuuchiae]|uniref:response regulator n=1 Tax=Legionella yabuuchiae TaxID=376727 RepID=UPI001054A942|nr:response regulator [Legionella yabuuchiae]